LGLLVAVSVMAALIAGGRSVRRPPDRAASTSIAPATVLAVVVATLYANQLLVAIYVLREHGGDPSFVAGYVPDGWFSLPHGPLVKGLARHWPVPGLLAPSVLRVNAFLELPFVVLAYLTACRWFSPAVYARSLGLVGLVAVAYTATFGLIEWHFHNPYTTDDLVVRGVAAVVVPLVIARLLPTSSPPVAARTINLPGLLVFGASAASLGLLVLVVYDTALLYNLGHLDTQLPVAAAALLVLVAARTAAAPAAAVPSRAPGPGIDTLARSTGWLLVLAFVPALPVRYGLGFGARSVAVAAAIVLVAAAARRGIHETAPGRPVRLAAQLAVAATAGLAAAAVPALLVDTTHTEARLLLAAITGFAGALAVCALLDRRQAPVRELSASGPVAER
jgi:hypothetical protein